MLSIRCNSHVKSCRNQKYLQRITKIKPFINKKLGRINYSSKIDDWNKIEKNNFTIVLNVLYAENEKIYSAYFPKHNSNREKQIILLMILNGEGWHYLAVQKHQHY